MGDTACAVSFVVPAYNEELVIDGTLRALRDAGSALASPFEIVVADDASTDRTAAIAHAHGARVVSVRNRQIAATRNAGAKVAHGEMLVFVDADTIVTPAVARAALAAMRGGAVGGGSAFRFDGTLPLYGRVIQKAAVPLYRLIHLASGCFLFATRRAFDAVGGFDEGLYAAEEYAMSQALRRHGRFVVLRESVTTSGRKLRTFSARESLSVLARLAFLGVKGVRRREGLELWYGARRMDPQAGG